MNGLNVMLMERNTETIALETFVAACREHQFEPDLKVYYQCIGGNYNRTKEILINGYGPDFPYSTITEHWRRRYDGELQNLSL